MAREEVFGGTAKEVNLDHRTFYFYFEKGKVLGPRLGKK